GVFVLEPVDATVEGHGWCDVPGGVQCPQVTAVAESRYAITADAEGTFVFAVHVDQADLNCVKFDIAVCHNTTVLLARRKGVEVGHASLALAGDYVIGS